MPGAVAPNLAHLADRTAFAGDMYLTNYDNLWKWIYNAPSRKPMGKLVQHMPNFSAAGHDPGGSAEDRVLPADEHRHDPEPARRSV